MSHRPIIITVVFALPLFALGAAQHPPTNGHDHPHNDKHATVQPSESRFVTSRASDVVLPLPNEEDSFFFVVFGDRTGGPAEGVKVLAQAVKDTNLIEPDLVMTVGDLVQGYNERDEWMTQMREYRDIMNKLLCPWFPVAGNHDIYWRPGHTAPAEEHEGDYEQNFGPLWYAFEHKNCWFVSLFSDEANPSTGERNFSKPECQVMSDAQYKWLKETLARASDATHVFVFLHHPRWLGGQYGDDWEKVHQALVDAGNVTAVFAGHIHMMRYDGPRDGIEYVTLATVGGAQSGRVPEAGYLHQYHIVTVRKNQIAMASIPIGETMDVRAITGTVSYETSRLAQIQLSFEESIAVEPDGSANGIIRTTMRNVVSRPVEVAVTPRSADSRWSFAPDHSHRTLIPGETHTFEFSAARLGKSIDDTFRLAEIAVDFDYLAPTARFSIPTIRSAVPLNVDLTPPRVPSSEQVLTVDGRSGHLAIPSIAYDVPDGPLTVECWMNARSFGDRVGLLAKTENPEYGIFVNKGVPSFSVFLDDRYSEARASEAVLKVGQWHHVAGVFDGQETRLYVDGNLLAATKRSGLRRLNGFPLMIGADVDPNGNPTSYFDGQIDAVRVSSIARYTEPMFKPVRRPLADAETALLLNFDGMVGPWTFDESSSRSHAMPSRGASIEPAR